MQKAQAHGGEFSYSIEDSALLWDIMEFWIKEGGRQVTQNVKGAESPAKESGPSASAAKKKITIQKEEEGDKEEQDEEESDEIAPITYHSSKKGKGRAE